MGRHEDIFSELNRDISLQKKLDFLHTFLGAKYDFIERIAIALYEAQSDRLRTHADSTCGQSPLQNYEVCLASIPSLQEVAQDGHPRVVNDLKREYTGPAPHSRALAARYCASYTLPMYNKGRFLGFVFFNGNRKNCFDSKVLHDLDMVGHLIAMTVAAELASAQAMTAALKTARDLSHHRDAETCSHLERMAQYSKLIALELADRHDLSDEFIEYLFLYAPLHDIGKIGIPDKVLLKPAKLSNQEFEIMKRHVDKGREIVDSMVNNFQIDRFPYTHVLRNIVELHHEAVNGEGYLKGLQGESIPIEARIVAVADVFDALTSQRPYKMAWNNEQAFVMLHNMAGSKLDADCVAALCRNEMKILEIQRRFSEAQGTQDSA